MHQSLSHNRPLYPMWHPQVFPSCEGWHVLRAKSRQALTASPPT